MALKVHLITGDFVCPKCGTTVSESDEKCPKCGTVFEGVKLGKKCPKCGTINDADALICSACGYTFESEKKEKKSSAKSDEEFLQKLLTWSKSLAEQEAEEYQEEAEMVINVFKKVTGINIEALEEEEGEEWERKLKRIGKFLNYLVEIMEDEREALEKRLKSVRKQSTKEELKEQIDVIEKEIKGLKRSIEDLEYIGNSIKEILRKKDDEAIEKERQLRKEIANIKKGSMKREEDLRAHINSLNREIEELRKRIGQESSAKMLLEDWLEMERKLEEEIAKLKEKEKDERISEFIFEMEKEMRTILQAVKMRIEEENELRRILKVLDDLLENLPDRIIEDFARSEDFKLYERVLDRYHVGE